MKKLALFAATALLIGSTLQSCNKVKEAIKADVGLESTSVEFNIPVITTTAPGTALGSITMNVNVDSVIKAANSELGAGNIQNAKLKSMSLELTNNDSENNISNFSSMSVSFHSNAKADEQVLATASIPDVAGSWLDLNANTTIELKDYMNSNAFYYTLTGQARRVTNHELHAKLIIKYTLTVSL